jgi:hypothetical protein
MTHQLGAATRAGIDFHLGQKPKLGGRYAVTTQDFIKFWGKFFAFVLLEMIGISQGFKTFESI